MNVEDLDKNVGGESSDDEPLDPEMIQLGELLKEMKIDGKEISEQQPGEDEEDNTEIDQFVKQLGSMKMSK